MFKDKIYMSSTPSIRDEYMEAFGIIESLASSGHRPNVLDKGFLWCLDNGVYTGKFTHDKLVSRLEKCLPWKDTCTFVASPDVLYNPQETHKNFFIYYKLIKETYGYPIAYILQDGFMEKDLPYDLVDVFFVGGSTKFKLSRHVLNFINYCNKINKKIHIGRVNSIKRLKHFKYANSWDGTHLNFQPSDDEKFYNYILNIRKKVLNDSSSVLNQHSTSK